MAENNTPSKKTFAERAAAEPTELHKQFAAWIEEKTGQKVDLKTVQLASVLRMDFQRSDENQAALKERKAKAEQVEADRVAKRRIKLEAELAKLNGTVAEETPKPETPAEAPKADAEPEAPADAENGTEKPVETAPKAAPARRARRTRKTAE